MVREETTDSQPRIRGLYQRVYRVLRRSVARVRRESLSTVEDHAESYTFFLIMGVGGVIAYALMKGSKD